MSNTKKIVAPLALAITSTVAVAGMMSAQAENPFGANELSSGYMQLAASHMEGKCGEGKCGGGDAKDKEGKCGEGKCGGGAMMDADGDGKVTKEEFMKAHEAMFAKKDADGNGVLEGDELKAKEGKCGEGKCGGDKGKSEGKCGEGKCGGK